MECCRTIIVSLAFFWVCFYAVAKEDMRYSMSCENGVCYRPDDEGPCLVENDRPKLYRWEPIRKGYTREIELEPGKKYKMTTVANKPPIFEIRDFLSPEECEHIKKLAIEKGLHTSITHFDENLIEKRKNIEGHAEGAASSFGSWDMNKDLFITKDEFIHFAEKYKYLYLTEEDVDNMIKKLRLKEMKDGKVTIEEFLTFPTASIDSYMNVLKDYHPRHKERYSNQAWIPHGKTADPMIRALRERIKILTRLPEEIIRGSEPLQVVRYDKDGHYNGHYDSQSTTAHPPEFKCCHTTVANPPHCRLCRYATVLYYLNDVEEGGETAFPAADNETYSEEELVKNVKGDVFNLMQNCHQARLVVPAEQGKAILWYNHFVDEDNGFLGERDDYTIHGGCGVTKGYKWVANNWITALDPEWQTLRTNAIDMYLNDLKDNHPHHRDRYSKQVWLFQGKKSDDIMKRLRKRIWKLTKLPKYIIYGGEPLQVVGYDKRGHYNAHYDGTRRSDFPKDKCCHFDLLNVPFCRLCRYITVLYYLNDVEEGGETAFPVADVENFNETEFRDRKEGNLYNLHKYCHSAKLVVPPKKGKAILWYNFLQDEKTGWMGPREDRSLHGGCDVKKGHKFVANNWLPAPESDSSHLRSDYLDDEELAEA